MSDLLGVLAVLALVAANAFLVIGEYSVVTARRARLAARAEDGSRGAQAALRLKDDPVRVISTVQVGITAIGILPGAVGRAYGHGPAAGFDVEVTIDKGSGPRRAHANERFPSEATARARMATILRNGVEGKALR